jgi:hypothetical protein
MALSIPGLSGEIKAQIVSCYGTADDDTKLQCFCDAMATAIINHITANAVVNPTNMLDSFSGQVTGTGTIT